MRILVNALSVAPGGGLTVASGLIGGLASTGDDELVVLSRDGVLESVLADVGAVTYVHGGHLTRPGSLRSVWEQANLARMMKRFHCDVLVGLGGFGVIRGSLPQVVVVQNAYFYVSEPWMSVRSRVRLRGQRVMQLRALRAGALGVCVSDYMRELVLARHGGLRSQLAVIPNGVEPGSSRGRPWNPDEPLRILWVGNAGRHKNLEDLVGALPKIEAQVDAGVTLAIAGEFSPSERQVVDQRLRDYGGSAQLVFLGFLSRGALDLEFAMAHVYASTSRLESFDLGVMEAVAIGLPVVVSDIPVRHEFVPMASRYPLGDPESLAREIVASARQGPSSHPPVGLLSWSEVAREYRHILVLATEPRGAM